VRINDALFGLVLILSGVAVLLVARTFPDMPGQAFGPALLPSLIGLGFVACGAALVVAGLRYHRHHPWIELGEWADSRGHVLDVGLVVGGLVLLILLWDVVGFLIGATLFLGGLISRFRGGKPATSLALAVVAALAVDWGFRHLLLVPLPLGPLTGLYW
jgi:putative tricarboxylic transport membrane protein